MRWGLPMCWCRRIEVRAAALKLATEIAENAPLGLVSTRATMRGDLADRVRAATEHELGEQTRLRKTDDFKEGVKATGRTTAAEFPGPLERFRAKWLPVRVKKTRQYKNRALLF